MPSSMARVLPVGWNTRSGYRILVIATIVVLAAGLGSCTDPAAAPDVARPATAAPVADDPDTDPGAVVEPTPGAVDAEPIGPRLDETRFASVTNLAAGESVTDAQGNLISVYGLAHPPASVLAAALKGSDGDRVADDSRVAVDVAMCAPGEIIESGDGAVEFAVSEDAGAEFVSPVPPGNRPLRAPGFSVPAAQECRRGWAWVNSGGSQAPTVVRYLVSAWSDGAVQRHLYQWTDVEVYRDGSGPVLEDDSFPAGRQVRFERGLAQGVEATVFGWAELIDAPVSADQTRAISVSVEVCAPAEPRLAQLRVGLGSGGWTVDALGVDQSEPVTIAVAQDSTECSQQWVDFVVPHGFVPESVYLSDGVDAGIGFALWSLAGAALAEPE